MVIEWAAAGLCELAVTLASGFGAVLALWCWWDRLHRALLVERRLGAERTATMDERTCVICRFPVKPDDEMFPVGAERCVCLACFARHTDSAKPLPEALRRQLRDVLMAVRIEGEY